MYIFICVTQIVEVEDKKIPTFVLIVHLAGKEKSHNLQQSSEGWLVTRTIPDFNSLHEKLIEVSQGCLNRSKEFTLYFNKLYFFKIIRNMYRNKLENFI